MIKILFIEDDPDLVMIYKFKFQKEDILLIPSDNSEEVSKIVAKGIPDVILLDILLKNENGLDILEMLRNDPKLKNTPVIVFTNFDNKDMRNRAKKLGVIDYVIKSRTYPQEMVYKIRNFLITGEYAQGVAEGY
jgi:DNA-binding response OmpR family regulator